MNSRALAPAQKLAPQEVRTFFVSTKTWGGRSILQTERMAELLLDVLRVNREKGRFELHEFVIMRNHLHLILTPAANESLEKCVQYIKGGFSFRAKKELGFVGEIWQAGFNERRIKGMEEYVEVAQYVRENPVKAGMVREAKEWNYSSANDLLLLDPIPAHYRG
jgi:putative transposase